MSAQRIVAAVGALAVTTFVLLPMAAQKREEARHA
jgi:hypothetical protein